MSSKSLCVRSGWILEHGYDSDLNPLFPSFDIQQHTLFHLTDSMHSIKQLKTQSTKQHLLEFNILHFAKAHYAEQETVAESIYLKPLKQSMGKSRGIQTALSKYFLLLFMPKPQKALTFSMQPLSYAIVWKSCCLYSCSSISGFSYQRLVHQMHQHFNIPAQLYRSTGRVEPEPEHGISYDKKPKCKVLNCYQSTMTALMYTAEPLKGIKPAFF